MGKKRKASARAGNADSGPNLDVGSSKKRIKTFEDVADSDDDFHINRDKVLLDEGPDAKRRRNWQEQEEFLQPSDEEVLGYSEPEEDSEDDEQVTGDAQSVDSEDSDALGAANKEDDEGEEGWGTSRQDIYGADVIETEEQALEEEAEALRLQRKQLRSMSAADYGFDESDSQGEATEEEPANSTVVTEVLPQLQVTDDMGPAEKLKLLKTRYPEFEPLSKELLGMKETVSSLAAHSASMDSQDGDSHRNVLTKQQAASAYIAALTMYFALLTSPASNGQANGLAMPANMLRDHPVMDSLMKCRDLWSRAEALPVDVPLLRAAENDSHDSGLDLKNNDASKANDKTVSKPKKSRAQRHADALKSADEIRRAERMKRTEADLADLDALIAPAAVRRSNPKQKVAAPDNDSDIGEEAPLTAQEAAEKAKRKKSLRFYTSQIAQKSNKRGTAGRNAGGDDDVPHRERLRDRQARLIAEAEKRGRKPAEAGEELGGESDEEDQRQARQLRDEAGSDDDYYDMVAARSSKKKSDKIALAEAQRQAALQGGQVIQEETVGTDGKRKISYLIEKNRGLTPHRKKDVRNPRVKKRKKYDEKKKKLASIKPVYKGGEGRGGYGGEATGIKKGLVKSTKLG